MKIYFWWLLFFPLTLLSQDNQPFPVLPVNGNFDLIETTIIDGVPSVVRMNGQHYGSRRSVEVTFLGDQKSVVTDLVTDSSLQEVSSLVSTGFDFNGDDQQDWAFSAVDRDSQGWLLLVEGGDPLFGPIHFIPMDVSGVSQKHVLVDLDLDGDPDVVIRRNGAILALYNDGQGAFTEGNVISVDGEILPPADLDNDGDLDLMVVAGPRREESTYFLRNDAGQLAMGIEIPGVVSCVVDADSDGDLDPVFWEADLLDANPCYTLVFYLQNTWEDWSEVDRIECVNYSPRKIATTDINMDGTPDLLLLNSTNNGENIPIDRVRRLDGDPLLTGTYREIELEFGEERTSYLALEDMSGDGLEDLVVYRESLDRIDQYTVRGGMGFYPGTGNGFGDLVELSTSGGPLIDGDLDGDLDFVSGAYNSSITYFENESGSFGGGEVIGQGGMVTAGVTVLFDVDGNGFEDLIAIDSVLGRLHIAESLGDGRFEHHFFMNGELTGANQWEIADLNQDGTDELYVSVGPGGSVHPQGHFPASLFRVDLAEDFSALQLVTLFHEPSVTLTDFCFGDVNQDGFLDIVGTSTSGESLFWCQNNGNGEFLSLQRLLATGDPAYVVAAGDINGNGVLDIVVELASTVVIVEIEAEFEVPLPYRFVSDGRLGFRVRQLELGDFDDRPGLDIVINRTWSEASTYATLQKWSFAQNWTLEEHMLFRVGCAIPIRFALTDWDGEGRDDILFWDPYDLPTMGVATEMSVTLFNRAQYYVASDRDESPFLDLTDIDGDGKNEIVLGGGTGFSWIESELQGLDDFFHSVGTPSFGSLDLEPNSNEIRTQQDSLNRSFFEDSVVSSDAVEPIQAQFDLDGDGSAEQLVFGRGRIGLSLEGGDLISPETINDKIENLTAGDLDGDGIVDLVIAAYRKNQLKWHKGLGGMRFSSGEVISHNVTILDQLDLMDVDADGRLDIILSSHSYSFGGDLGYVLNLGDHLFSKIHSFESRNGGSGAIQFCDWDHDGDLDVLTQFYANSEQSRQTIRLLENIGERDYVYREFYEPGSYFLSDSDDDGDKDLASVTRVWENHFLPPPAWQMSDGTVSFPATGVHRTFTAGDHSWRVRHAVDGASSSSGVMSAYPNTGTRYEELSADQSPKLLYQFSVDRPGTYDLWVRALGETGSDDSLYFSVSGEESPKSMALSSTGDWSWTRQRIQFDEPGIVDLNVWMREDGILLDHVLLTENLSFSPVDETLPDVSERTATHRQELPILCGRIEEGKLNLTFTTLRERTYLMQHSTDLIQWETKSPSIEGDGTVVTQEVSTEGKGFYRFMEIEK